MTKSLRDSKFPNDMEPSKSDPTKDNKPETNVPLTGTSSASPGSAFNNVLGNANARVVPPYDSQEQPQVQPLPSQKPAQAPAKASDKGAAHNQRPASMGANPARVEAVHGSSHPAATPKEKQPAQSEPKQDNTKDSQDYQNRGNYPEASDSKLADMKKVGEGSQDQEGVVKHESEG